MRISGWSSDVCSSDLRVAANCTAKRSAAGGYLPTDLCDEGFEPLGGDGATGMVVLGERRVDRQLVSGEQGQRLKLDMAIALEQLGRASWRARVCEYV